MFYKTPAFQGYSIRFSPFESDKVAVACSQNFGIIGNGKQYVLQLLPQGGITEVAAFDTLDGLYDCCWSEENENILVSAGGDGKLKVWDTHRPPQGNPIRSLEEHTREVLHSEHPTYTVAAAGSVQAHSVHWNQVRRDCFLSGSWDDTIKLWNLRQPTSLRTFQEHRYCVYTVAWNPQEAEVFLSASGDCTFKIWDVRQPVSSLTVKAHDHEILTADWCKYNDSIVATGSTDKTIKLWDVRFVDKPITTIFAHSFAVRRLEFSPHAEHLLLSCSYDMTVRLWNTAALEEPLVRDWGQHSEFAVGINFSTLTPGLVASTGWDEMVYVWREDGDPRA